MSTTAARTSAYLIAWIGLIAWAVLGAPPSDGEDMARVLAWFSFADDPLPTALFNLMGVWPLVYGAVLLRDPPQRVPAWPFFVLSFAIGAFALLPYLAFRRWGAPARSNPGWVRRALTGRGLALVLALAAAGLTWWGLAFGSLDAFAEHWQSSPLTTAMTVDFAVLTLGFWPVLVDDVRRHGGPAWAAAVGAVPIVGPPLWLLARDRVERPVA